MSPVRFWVRPPFFLPSFGDSPLKQLPNDGSSRSGYDEEIPFLRFDKASIRQRFAGRKSRLSGTEPERRDSAAQINCAESSGFNTKKETPEWTRSPFSSQDDRHGSGIAGNRIGRKIVYKFRMIVHSRTVLLSAALVFSPGIGHNYSVLTNGIDRRRS